MDKELICCTMAILFIVVSATTYYYALKDFSIEEIDCFDEKNHKINGLTCDKKVANPSALKTTSNITLWIAIILMACAFIILGKHIFEK